MILRVVGPVSLQPKSSAAKKKKAHNLSQNLPQNFPQFFRKYFLFFRFIFGARVRHMQGLGQGSV